MVSPTYCVALAIVLRPRSVRSLRLLKKTTSWQPWWRGCLWVFAALLSLPGCIPDPDSPPVSENPALDLASLQVQEGGQDRLEPVADVEAVPARLTPRGSTAPPPAYV